MEARGEDEPKHWRGNASNNRDGQISHFYIRYRTQGKADAHFQPLQRFDSARFRITVSHFELFDHSSLIKTVFPRLQRKLTNFVLAFVRKFDEKLERIFAKKNVGRFTLSVGKLETIFFLW